MEKYTDSKLINGFTAGFVSTLVVTPVEKIKIDLQNNLKFRLTNYNFNNLFRGWTTNVLRERSGYTIYFSIYERLKNKNDLKLVTFVKGSTSGVGAWLFIYPFDYIKTLTQTEIKLEYNGKNIEKHIKILFQINGKNMVS